MRTNARLSGGTLATVLLAFSRADRLRHAAKARRAADPRPAHRSVRTPLDRVHHNGELGVWGVPLPTLDPQVVGRSAAPLERYGPRFRYSHYAAFGRLPVALGGIVGTGALSADTRGRTPQPPPDGASASRRTTAGHLTARAPRRSAHRRTRPAPRTAGRH